MSRVRTPLPAPTSLRPLRLDFALRAHQLRGFAPAARASSLLDSPPFVEGNLESCGVSPGLVIEGLVTEHGNEQGEEAIGDAAQGSAVAVTDLSQGLVVVSGPGIALGADPGPVVE